MNEKTFFIAGDSTERWILSFCDLMLLLLAFFIFRVSLSLKDLRFTPRSVGPLAGAITAIQNSQTNAPTHPVSLLFEDQPAHKWPRKTVGVYLKKRFFEPGTATLSFAGLSAINTFSRIAKSQNLNITVAVEISPNEGLAEGMISEWNAAAYRAVTIVRQMIDAGLKPDSIKIATDLQTRTNTVENIGELRFQNANRAETNENSDGSALLRDIQLLAPEDLQREMFFH